MRRVIIPILVVGLLITGYYAYNQQQTALDLNRRVEAQYQRSFHELVWNVDTIDSQLAQTLVSSSPEQIMLSLTNLWRETFAATSNLGGIPISMVELEKTDRLLNDIAEYSYHLLKQNNLDQKELTDKEWNKLQEFYERCQTVRNELQNVEAAVLDRDLSFAEVETVTLRRGQDLADNAIVDGFRTIESKVKAFPDMQFEEGVQKIEPEPRPIKGENISEEQAVQIAKKFMNEHDGPITKAEMAFSSNGKIPVYGVRTFKEDAETPTYVEVTQKGGHVIQMYMQRSIGAATMDYAQAEKVGREFLAEHEFQNVQLVDLDSDTNTAILTFVPTQDEVLLYSDMLKVNVALDKGQVINFDQTSYLSYHYNREISEPELPKKEVTDDMNPNFEVKQVRTALIPSQFENKEILVYEVRGSIKSEEFIIFVNANTGEDERIVRLTKPKQFEITTR